jgi:hypothetical protein
MRDAFAGRLALDDVGGLQKLLNLFLGERLIISTQHLQRNVQTNNEASCNDKKEYRQASGKFSHRESSENCLYCTPEGARKQLLFAPAGGSHCTTLLEILLYTYLLQHYPLSVCSYPVVGPRKIVFNVEDA